MPRTKTGVRLQKVHSHWNYSLSKNHLGLTKTTTTIAAATTTTVAARTTTTTSSQRPGFYSRKKKLSALTGKREARLRDLNFLDLRPEIPPTKSKFLRVNEPKDRQDVFLSLQFSHSTLSFHVFAMEVFFFLLFLYSKPNIESGFLDFRRWLQVLGFSLSDEGSERRKNKLLRSALVEGGRRGK